MLKMNKRGFELVWSTIVIMVLALVFLAVILVFFLGSSGNFIGTMKSYFSYSNVDNIAENCNLLASSGGNYVFCCEKKNVRYYEANEKKKIELTCNELSEKDFVTGLNKLNCGEIKC